MGRRDVFEFIVDGTSGLVPGDVVGKAVVAGVCSTGEEGKAYYLGKRSDLTGLLGVGPLTDRLNDIFSACGQDATVIAVPIKGQPAGYLGGIKHIGDGSEAIISGFPALNADVIVKVVDGGSLGTATVEISLNNGQNFETASAIPANGQLIIGATGATLIFDTDLIANDQYSFSIRTAIGPVEKIGAGPDITINGTPARSAQIMIQVVRSGERNAGQYRLSTDGGDNYGPYRTIPYDGLAIIDDTGLTATFPDESFNVGTIYTCNLLAPVPTIVDVISALETPLERIDPEFVYVVGESDSTDWAALGALSDDLWNRHRPTWFLAESRLPRAGEDLNDWTTALKAERDGFAHRFVSVCCAYGEIADRTGARARRNAGGLLAGRIIEIPVQRDIGRVRDQGISQLQIPGDFTESMQVELEEAGYITATIYAGLESVYWGDARTMADTTSDYQFLEVLRPTFKAVRLLRIQALKSLKDEAGDPLHADETSGLYYLQLNLENALDTMTKARPKELAAYVVDIPEGQDIVNNGVAVEATLIGIPIIKKIKLFANYVYAGGRFDPRLN